MPSTQDHRLYLWFTGWNALASCLLMYIMCVHYEFKRTCRYRILEAQELMLQENQISNGDSERLQFIMPKTFHDTNCRCQFTQGTPYSFHALSVLSFIPWHHFGDNSKVWCFNISITPTDDLWTLKPNISNQITYRNPLVILLVMNSV